MKIHIAKSKLHGQGIFASQNLKKGEIIFIVKGKKIKFLIHDEKSAERAGLDWFGVGKNEWVDPINHCVFFNHSCNPNAIIKGRVTIVANRDIKRGEEITFDYSTGESDIFWQMPCACREHNCRRVVRSIQFMSKNDFDKFKHYIPRHFKKVFNKFHISNFKNENEMRVAWISFLKKDFKK